VKSSKDHLGFIISDECELVEPFDELKGVAMTQKRHRSSWLYCSLHECLVVFFLMVFSIGEPAILQAGPCDDCERTKLIELAKCDAARTLNEKNCVTDATASAEKCVAIEAATIDKADVDRRAALRTAIGVYLTTVGGCALLPPPANLGCLVGATTVYWGAVGTAEAIYNATVSKARIDKTTCDNDWAIELKKCRTKTDDAFDACVKLANKAYEACKGKCNGPPQI
jgi:hypothetical protein